MNDNNDNRWLTVAEAASEYGMSERTLQRWIKQVKVISRLEKGRRLVLASSVSEAGEVVGGVSPLMSEVLQEENEELKGKVVTLEEEQRQLTDKHQQVMADLSEGKSELEKRISELEDEAQRQTDNHRQEMAKLSEDLQEAEKRGTLADELSQDKERLQQQLTEKDRQIENLQTQLQDASQRHDTVVMQMSKMLEYERMPFWRRWLRQKSLPKPVEGGDIVDVAPADVGDTDSPNPDDTGS